MRFHRIITAALLVCPPVAGAQQTPAVQRALDSIAERRASDEHPFLFLARPSRFAVGWPKGAMYEGDIRVPVHLYSRTSALRSFLGQDVPRRWSGCFPWAAPPESASTGRTPSGRQRQWYASGCTVTFVPHFVIRQMSSASAPVRTPSFNPGFDFTYYLLTASEPDDRQTPNVASGASLWAFSGRLAHYSNGQSGCFFVSFSVNARGDCVRTSAGPDTLNLNDGSFSSHYLEGEVTRGWLGFAKDGHDRRSILISTAVRWYPPIGLGGMDDDLARLYKRVTFLARGESRLAYVNRALPGWMRHREVVILDAESECAPGRQTPYRICRGAVEAAVTAPGLYGFGLFARYARGWDYYNIGFGKDLPKRPSFGVFLQHAAPVFFGEAWRPWSHR